MAWEKTISRNASTQDTINLIIETINKYSNSAFIEKLSNTLNPLTDKEAFIKRLFFYVCENVKYKLDAAGVEKVYTPERTIREGEEGGDCKKMATLIAAVLKHIGIEPLLKHVEFENENFTHIYVIIPTGGGKYITLDPVNGCLYNKEVKYDKGTIYNLKGQKMELKQMGKTPIPFNMKQASFVSGLYHSAATIDNDISSLAGCESCGQTEGSTIEESLFSDVDIITNGNRPGATRLTPEPMAGIGKGRKSKAERIEQRKKLVSKFKQIGLGAPRLAFLAVLRLNPMKLANKLAKAIVTNPTAVSSLWTKLGGKPEELKKMVILATKTPISGNIGIGITIEALIASATPVIIPIMKLISDLKSEAPTPEEIQAFDEKREDGEDHAAANPITTNRPGAELVPADIEKDTTPPPPKPQLGSFIHGGFINTIIKAPIYLTAFSMIGTIEKITFISILAIVNIYSLIKK
jgi:hypothetical protein